GRFRPPPRSLRHRHRARRWGWRPHGSAPHVFRKWSAGPGFHEAAPPSATPRVCDVCSPQNVTFVYIPGGVVSEHREVILPARKAVLRIDHLRNNREGASEVVTLQK